MLIRGITLFLSLFCVQVCFAQEFEVIITSECRTIDANPLFPPAAETVYQWDFGNTVTWNGHDPGPYTYPDSGTYTICLTAFDQGTGQAIGTTCQTVVIVPCCPSIDIAGFSIDIEESPDACGELAICLDHPPNFDGSEYCIEWDFGDGSANLSGPFENWDCVFFEYKCNGEFDLCAHLTCCTTGELLGTVCEQVNASCPCEAPEGPFAVSATIEGCEYSAEISGLCDDYCVTWETGDGAVYEGTWIQHSYLWPGTYDRCVTVTCCNGEGPSIVICDEVVAECDCSVPDGVWDLFYFLPFADVTDENCATPYFEIQSQLDLDLDDLGHCFVIDYGDGNVDSLSSIYGNLPNSPNPQFFTHTYWCDGVYDVCLTTYCCDDPDISTTTCSQIEIDCPCKLQLEGLGGGFPGGGDINPPEEGWLFSPLVSIEGCELDVALSASCLDDYCVQWDFGDGFLSNEFATTHLYQADGNYEVCVTVSCCDDPALSTEQCQMVNAACEECPEDPCPGDLNGDLVVNTSDLLAFLTYFDTQCE